MRLTLTFTVAAIGCILFGFAYLLIPGSLLSLYGITLDPTNQWIARLFGTTLIGFAAILWLARKATSGPALRGILVGVFFASILGFFVAILQLILGSGNALVWSTLLIYFLLSLGFGDFVFRTPPPR